jgi:hypothetical protein
MSEAEVVSDAEYRRLWRLRWLDSLQELGDFEVQEKTWAEPPNPHFSYREYLCCYLDDCSLTKADGGYDRAIADGQVSPAEAEAVRSFHEALESYQEPGSVYDDDAVLRDPKWKAVVAEALSARNKLLPLLTDETERWHLTHA